MTEDQISFILAAAEEQGYYVPEELSALFPDIDWAAEAHKRDEERRAKWAASPSTGGVSMAEVSQIMKEVWEPAIIDLVTNSNPLIDFLKR